MRISTLICGAVAAMAVATPALATDFGLTPAPGVTVDPSVFSISPSGPAVFTATSISGSIKRDGLTGGTFTDNYLFTIPQNGLGSGAVITSGSLFSSTDLDFKSVTFDGIPVPISVSPDGGSIESAGLVGAKIVAGVQNDLQVTYFSRGNGSYAGQLTFTAVPEPATWMMLLAGFAVLGFALRRRQGDNTNVRVRYAI